MTVLPYDVLIACTYNLIFIKICYLYSCSAVSLCSVVINDQQNEDLNRLKKIMEIFEMNVCLANQKMRILEVYMISSCKENLQENSHVYI